jgi:hypothetical protein
MDKQAGIAKGEHQVLASPQHAQNGLMADTAAEGARRWLGDVPRPAQRHARDGLSGKGRCALVSKAQIAGYRLHFWELRHGAGLYSSLPAAMPERNPPSVPS